MTDRGPVTQSLDEMKCPPGSAHCGMAHMAGRAFLRRKGSGKRRWRQGKRKRPQEKYGGVAESREKERQGGERRRGAVPAGERARGRKENLAAGGGEGHMAGEGARGEKPADEKSAGWAKIFERGTGKRNSREREKECGKNPGKGERMRKKSREGRKNAEKIPEGERGVWDLGSKRGKAGVGRHQFFG